MNDHLLWLVVFSFLVSLVFTFLTKIGLRERVKYFLYLFGCFVLISIVAAWLMFPLPL